MSKPTNLKPKEWYEVFLRNIIGFPEEEIEERVLDGMERDKEINKGLDKHTKLEVKNDYWYERGHTDFLIADVFNKDEIELQKEIIDYYNKFIDKNEIKKYLKKRTIESPNDISYQFLRKFMDHLNKALNQGYHIYRQLGLLGYFIEDLQKDYEYDKSKQLTFPEYVRKTIKDNRLSRIAESLIKGKTYQQIDDENIDIPFSFIDKNAKLMREHKHNKYKLGEMFEDWYALHLGAPKEFLHEIVAHNEHTPDIIWNGKIYSLKLRFSREKTLTFYQSVDFKPEFEKAIKKKSTYFFVFLNPTWSSKILIKEINPFEDGDKIVCKPNRITVLTKESN
ncbi:MAG: hypothetical protein ACFFCV_02525 [Promethearchaeota archaeon]